MRSTMEIRFSPLLVSCIAPFFLSLALGASPSLSLSSHRLSLHPSLTLSFICLLFFSSDSCKEVEDGRLEVGGWRESSDRGLEDGGLGGGRGQVEGAGGRRGKDVAGEKKMGVWGYWMAERRRRDVGRGDD